MKGAKTGYQLYECIQFHQNRSTGLYEVINLAFASMAEKTYGKFRYMRRTGRDSNRAHPEYKDVANLLSTESIELVAWHNENTPISHSEDIKLEIVSR
jgi:hypothetical protein